MKILFLLFLFLQILYSGEGLKDFDIKKIDSKQEIEKLYRKIQNDHKNIGDRKKLMYHYIAVNDEDMVKTLAKQILEIKPDDSQTLTFLKKYRIALDPPKKKRYADPDSHKNDALLTLKMYSEHKEYKLFLDLFKVMQKDGVKFSKEILILAIDAAIELREYKIAQNIILNYDFKHTKNYKKFVKLLNRKLYHRTNEYSEVLMR